MSPSSAEFVRYSRPLKMHSAPTHHKNHQGQVDQPMGFRISMCAQDFIPGHFLQVSVAEVEAGISPEAPLDKEVVADALGHPWGPVDQCPSQQDVMGICAEWKDTKFPSVVRSCLDGYPN